MFTATATAIATVADLGSEHENNFYARHVGARGRTANPPREMVPKTMLKGKVPHVNADSISCSGVMNADEVDGGPGGDAASRPGADGEMKS